MLVFAFLFCDLIGKQLTQCQACLPDKGQGKVTCPSYRKKYLFIQEGQMAVFDSPDYLCVLGDNYNFILCIFVVVAFIWFYPVL